MHFSLRVILWAFTLSLWDLNNANVKTLLDYKEQKYSRGRKRQDRPIVQLHFRGLTFSLLPGLTLLTVTCILSPSAAGTADYFSFTWQSLLPTVCRSVLTFRLWNLTVSWLEFKPFLYISALTHNTIYLLIPYIHKCQERKSNLCLSWAALLCPATSCVATQSCDKCGLTLQSRGPS